MRSADGDREKRVIDEMPPRDGQRKANLRAAGHNHPGRAGFLDAYITGADIVIHAEPDPNQSGLRTGRNLLRGRDESSVIPVEDPQPTRPDVP